MKNLPLSAQRRAAKSQAQSDSLRVSNEQTLIAAHKAGIAYWRNNRPVDATREALESHARSCGWHGADNTAWIAGYYGELRRMTGEVL
jgi:hypothetical protein